MYDNKKNYLHSVENKQLDSFKEIFDNLVDMVSKTDINGFFQYVTPSHKSILGYEPEYLIGKNVLNLLHDDDVDYIAGELKKLIKESSQSSVNTPSILECRYKHKHGHFLYIEVQVKPLFDKSAQTKGFIFSARDITEKKEKEVPASESEEYYKKLIEFLPDSVYIQVGNKNVFSNKAGLELLGFDKLEQLVGRNVIDFIHVDSRPTYISRCEAIEKHKTTPISKTKIIRLDGSIIHVESASCLIKYKGENAVLSVIRDITNQLETEKLLIDSEEKYRNLVEFMPEAVYIIDRNTLLFSNSTGVSFLGAEKLEDIIGKNLWDIVYVDKDLNKENPEKNLENIFKMGLMPLTEQKITSRINGKTISVEIISRQFPFYKEDVWLVVCRDISEKKQLLDTVREKDRLLEETLKYDKLRAEFITNVSHELRTPVNVMFSALQMIESINNSSNIDHNIKIDRYLNMMKQNNLRLIRLINNILDITKIDSGHIKLNKTESDIVKVIEDITISVVEYAKNKEIELIFDTNVEEKSMVFDSDMLERIMLNLLSNSIKFTPKHGKVIVEIEDGHEFISIFVKDTGVGVPAEKQKAIFERFVQVDKSLSRISEGSGIGLAIVKSLVDLHGGQISLKSKLGKGSEFTIKIPVYLVKDDEILKLPSDDCKSQIEQINIEFSDIYECLP